MSFVVLIPARMASSRLPNKPLADIAGVPMVVRVAQQAQRSQASRVVVAADDARIVAAAIRSGIALNDSNLKVLEVLDKLERLDAGEATENVAQRVVVIVE